MRSSSPHKYDFIIIDDPLQWRDAVRILVSKISVDGKSQMVKDEEYWAFVPWLKSLDAMSLLRDKDFVRDIILRGLECH